VGVYSAAGNAKFYAAESDPRLPENLAVLVSGIMGLENYTSARPASSPVCTGPYCPQGIQIGYGLNNLYTSGYNGAGVNVAIVVLPGDPSLQNSFDTFNAQFHLSPLTVATLYPDGVPTYYSPIWGLETALDVEAAHAVAPGAGITVLCGSSPADDPINLIDYAAFNHIAPIISNSWLYACGSGPCSDDQLPPAFVTSVDSRLAVDAAQGTTIVFASGDYGAIPDGNHFGATFPGSDPYVLAVGATNLALTGCNATSCSGYGSETGATISGGGYSGRFAEPFWQLSTIGARPGRAVPDISMLGSSPGFWTYSTSAGWFTGSGTSLSTPLLAGYLAIATQMRGGNGFGNITPRLYGLASDPTYPTLFHDITVGSNGYPAGVGWDPVTGWGSPTSALAAALSSQTPTGSLDLESRDLNSTTTNRGTITIGHTTYALPTSVAIQAGTYTVTYAAESGYVFASWEWTGDMSVSQPTSRITIATLGGGDAQLVAIYKLSPPVPPAAVTTHPPVGGYLTPANKSIIIAPYLSLFAFAIVVVVSEMMRRRLRRQSEPKNPRRMWKRDEDIQMAGP